MQTILYLSFGILIGMLSPVPASFSSHLSSYSKTPLTPSFIALSLLGGIDFSYPAYIYIGGALAGVGYNVANILLFSKIGASIAAIITITGQMVAGIIIDHFGLFGITEKVISAQRVIGILIMLYAVFLIQKEKGNFKRSSQIGWIVMGGVSGSLPPLQAAINAKLRYATGSTLSATSLSLSEHLF
jgi:transporter family-2 protein